MALFSPAKIDGVHVGKTQTGIAFQDWNRPRQVIRSDSIVGVEGKPVTTARLFGAESPSSAWADILEAKNSNRDLLVLPGGERLRHIERVVRAAVVDHQNLEVPKRLIQYALKGLRQVTGVFVTGNHNRHLRGDLSLLRQADPTFREKIGSIVRRIIKPWFGNHDDFVGRISQKGGPPAKRTVWQNEVAAASHQIEISAELLASELV